MVETRDSKIPAVSEDFETETSTEHQICLLFSLSGC